MKHILTLLAALLLPPLAALHAGGGLTRHAVEAPKSSAPAATCEFPADWFLYGMADRNTPEPDFTAITDIPATLDPGGLSLSVKATHLERCQRFLYLDLQTRHGGAWSGRTAYLLTSIDSDADRSVDAGAGADSRMKIWCNGRVVCDALDTNDTSTEYIKQRFTLPLI